MEKRPSLRLVLLSAIALVILLVQVLDLAFDVHTPLQRGELAVRDTMMRARGVTPTSGDVVIVAIDDASFSETGYQWPWPRAYFAKIVDTLHQAGARVIGLDVFLFEADKDPEGDAALAKSIQDAGNFVSLVQVFQTSQGGQVITSLNQPLKIFRPGLAAMGTTTVTSDPDAITRSILAFERYGSTTYYNWAFEVTRLYLGTNEPSQPASSHLTFNGQEIPLENGRLLVNFAGPPNTYPTYSAYQVVDGDIPPETFRNKIVLIGATTVTLQDIYPTPFSAQQRTAGVEVVANAIDTLIQGKYLRETPPWADLLIVVLAVFLASLIIRTKQPSLIIVLLVAAMVIYAVVGFVLFTRQGLYLPMVAPEIALFLGVTLPTVERAVSEEVEKRRVRSLFTRFISPEMVDQLIATQDINSLNKRANISILFSDIRGFTTLSEKLLPEEVVAVLNPYLEAMTEVIYQHGGTVDKYEGDAIVAFFGEPVSYADHALRAVRAAVDMRKALEQLKKRWEQEGHPRPNLEMGVGINSGEVFVGMLGSAQRINYTVIGDAANLAARIQDLTKTYVWPILISESTYQAVKEEFEAEFADSVVVKGKSAAVNIYKVTGRKGADEQVKGWK